LETNFGGTEAFTYVTDPLIESGSAGVGVLVGEKVAVDVGVTVAVIAGVFVNTGVGPDVTITLSSSQELDAGLCSPSPLYDACQ